MPKSSNSLIALPPEAANALVALGQRLRARRLAQNMTIEQAAERLLCSKTTYRHLEQGQPTVSLGLLAHALWLFGVLEGVGQLAPIDLAILSAQGRQRAQSSAVEIRDEERNF